MASAQTERARAARLAYFESPVHKKAPLSTSEQREWRMLCERLNVPQSEIACTTAMLALLRAANRGISLHESDRAIVQANPQPDKAMKAVTDQPHCSNDALPIPTPPPAEWEERESDVSSPTGTDKKAGNDEEAGSENELKQALALSMQPNETVQIKLGPAANPLWAPPRYEPPNRSEASLTLGLRERIELRDANYAWQPASAFCDTGNQHMTIVDETFAALHGIYLPNANSVFNQADRWTTIRGVVPGASSKAPVVTIQLRIRGHEFTIEAAISCMAGEAVLLGMDVLERLFAAGFRMGAGSV
eukprot:CAMPEP_0119316318 /NCGR_PEP_ID=MMETSP1333-20130426/39407_1 /TAXON_ID=418940 /ORGANISM="Scyphosphaera apsteinii, Strain RCC1455" /LENGTH=303 /DNA_ID=CAMNT_0007321933 /DNA_START=35 /DNA_END=946 /DNA_ORIENTATION=+